MAKVVIIGAGLTGISTAYHLEQNGFFDYTLFERERTTGGLCRSEQHEGFTFDYTGHLLHASDPYFYQLMCDVVGLENLNVIDRRSFIYSHETFTKYPFQINLYGLPAQVIIDCIMGYVKRVEIKNPETFREWVQTHFGEGFGNHFFYTYQEKIFAHPIDQITASWTGRFVPQTSLEQILNGSLSDQQDSVGYNARFLYPKKGGIQSWVHTLANQIQNRIATEHSVCQIDAQKKIVYFSNGHFEPYETLVTTMPLDRLLGMMKEPSDSLLSDAQKELKCNTVVNFNIGVNRPNLSEKHWVYFPEKEYPFYRIGFWHNFSKSMAPEGCSSLYGEFAYNNKSEEWVSQTLDHSLRSAKKVFSLSESDIITQKTFSISHAYVTYDHWREKNLPGILAKLATHAIHSVGRYGAWKYASMQEAVLDGKDTADLCLKEYNALGATTHEAKERAHE